MDLEALTSEQLELALKLSDILSMEDLTVAAAVLSSFDWNIEVPYFPRRKHYRNFKSDQPRTAICHLPTYSRANPLNQNSTSTMKWRNNMTTVPKMMD